MSLVLRRSLVCLALSPVAVALADDDVEIEVEAAPPTSSTPAPAPIASSPPTPVAPDPELAALRATVEKLEARLAAVEAAPTRAPAPAVEATPKRPLLEVLDLRISGYLQPQFVSSELSQDEVDSEGDTLNQDRFVLKRARLDVARRFKFARAHVEIDLNTVNGPWLSTSGADVAVFFPSAGDTPYVELSAGVFDVPFGFELPESSRERYFMDRTLGSRALFPGDIDTGAQLSGGLGPVRYGVAVVNGTPLTNTSADASVVYTGAKTFVGRVGAEAGTKVTVAGGVSFLTGTGFHAGTPATKPSLLWSDNNQNGLVSLDELVGVNPQAATASETFEQFAVNADVRLGFQTPLGWTRVSAEATMASNLDRGYLVADPVSYGYDLREVAWTAAATQDIFAYGVAGFRVDSYDANSDMFEARRGDFLPLDLSVLTLSPLVGVQLEGVGRLLFQYDYVVDHLGRDALAQPIDLKNDKWTLRAQVEL